MAETATTATADGDDDRRRARAIAAAALHRAAAAGVTLPPTLRLWSLAGDDEHRPDGSHLHADREGATSVADSRRPHPEDEDEDEAMASGSSAGPGGTSTGCSGRAGGAPAVRDVPVDLSAGRSGGAVGEVGDPGGPGGPDGPGGPGGTASSAESVGPTPRPAAVGAGEGLAAVLEAVTPAEVRQANGLHVTPDWLADELVALALDGVGIPADELTICDPACGGGAFLLGAARALQARGVDHRHIVRHLLWGADVDPVGLAAAEVALALWAGEAGETGERGGGGEAPPSDHLVVGDPLIAGRDLWPAAPAPGFGTIVGNPPFLNQLGRATVRPVDLTQRLRQRFGRAVRPYTDTAWLFLLLGCELVREGGRVGLIQPISLVAARDAAVVRAALDHQADLRHLWVERQRSFAAGVKVCAPVLEVHRPATAPTAGASRRSIGGRARPVAGRTWADHLADAMGVPPVEVPPGCGRLGERAGVLAGFRDEYYGLVPLVREAGRPSDHGPDRPGARGAETEDGGRPGQRNGRGTAVSLPSSGSGRASERPLVTAGVIDWGRCLWGERPSRFAKQRWTAPVVDLSLLDGRANRHDGADEAGDSGPGREAAVVRPAGVRPETDAADEAARTGGSGELARDAARWVERTGRPKIVVATQTRVVEAAVDEGGVWVPSVPTLAVLPHDPDDLWPLAAALSSPTATAWLLRRAPETGLSRGALKIAAPDLADLPLPVDPSAWQSATTALRAYATDPTPTHLDAFTRAAAAAYQAPPPLVTWWHARLGHQTNR